MTTVHNYTLEDLIIWVCMQLRFFFRRLLSFIDLH